MATTQASPLVYAELLLNIRQVSVIATFGIPCSATTQAGLSGDGKQFLLRHDGRTTILNLPGEVALQVLPSPTAGSLEYSWRLPLAGTYNPPDVSHAQSNESPWAATTLSQESEFSCLRCGNVIIQGGHIQSWRDLPSENWAEMMDFWHCHKPSVHAHQHPMGSQGNEDVQDHPDLTTSKGYGASTKFSARDGVAFVDITSFLVSESNVVGAKPSSASAFEKFKHEQQEFPISELDSLKCNNCNSTLGYNDIQSEGYKIWKWNLVRKDKPTPTPRSWVGTVSIPTIVSSLISSVIASQGCSKLTLIPRISGAGGTTKADHPEKSRSATSHQSRSDSLNLWVLSSVLRYSSSRQMQENSHIGQCSLPAQLAGTPAMKIFWKNVSLETAKALADRLEVEEIYLPLDAFESVRQALTDSSSLLPENGRKFRGWEVGLLDRYELLDT
ncbi:hypothetical protein PVAG01_01042 [Phlyctema vagabunda]|uniref:HTH cro/C1-type domain-containing protein n=1 Tax=Phlyctema vagabunda TaxID=108571 RepID=A0ABR4PW13_9HELO